MGNLRRSLLVSIAAAGTAYSAGIEQIEHVVLFMQENRAFDHYFGTMAGVRGFSDPNVQIVNGRPIWYQKVNSQMTTSTDYLLPWNLNYLGGTWQQATQCMSAGSNGWSANQAALNGDLNNNWPIANTPWSIGYFQRNDIPAHFAIAEGWTVADMYQESVIASTNPNRASWLSGTINAPGSPAGASAGGMYIDNSETPGCEGTNLNCYPLKWQTAPELWQNAGVTWQVYQDNDNFDDNPLAWFQNFQKAAAGSPLQTRGMSFPSLAKFYSDAANGKLPQISVIVGPAELSEHPPYQPRDGAWLQAKIVDAVTSSPLYNSTALLISYDETGGWGDHTVPFHSPVNTTGEWVQDPYGKAGNVYTGPGFRLPFYIISPWTRGGNVYVEHADHSSQLMFVEKWLAAKGKNVVSSVLNPWRRQNMADLTKAFDFAHPDYSLPKVPNITYPSTDKSGKWNGYAVCEQTYSTTRPPVPYGKQSESTSLVSEQGYKKVRGQLTEGRYLTFEMNGYALTANAGQLSASSAVASHNSKAQRFVLHAVSGGQFQISSAFDKSNVGTFTLTDLGAGLGYSVKNANGQYLAISSSGSLSSSSSSPATGFTVFSVTYNN